MSGAPYASGRWYGLYHSADPNATQTPATNILYFAPFQPRTTATWDRIAVSVQTVSSGGTQVRLGIYNRHPTTWQPDTLLLDAGGVTTDTAGDRALTISQSLVGGVTYWLAAIYNGTPVVRRPANFALPSSLGGGVDMGLNPISGYQEARTFGALPAVATPALTNTAIPVRNGAAVILRAA